jgi:hypothetical protein
VLVLARNLVGSHVDPFAHKKTLQTNVVGVALVRMCEMVDSFLTGRFWDLKALKIVLMSLSHNMVFFVQVSLGPKLLSLRRALVGHCELLVCCRFFIVICKGADLTVLLLFSVKCHTLRSVFTLISYPL